MRTSNKLLLGLLIAMLSIITLFIGTAKYYDNVTSIEGSGNVITEKRDVTPFEKVNIKGKINVKLVQGNQHNVEVIAQENIAPLLKTYVEDGELMVFLEARVKDRDKPEITISVKDLNSLKFGSGASLETHGEIKGDVLDMRSSSGSYGDLKLNYNNMNCESSSGSSLKMEGTIDNATIDSSSGSHIKAENLKVNKLDVSGSSGSYIEIHVNNDLRADLSSGASLNYSGNPQISKHNVSSGGAMNKR